MTISKIILTKEQADALEKYKGDTFDSDNHVNYFVNNKGHFYNDWACLNDFTTDEFARLIYEPNSYEVIEPQLKVGEWVTFTVSVFNSETDRWKPKTYVDEIIEVSKSQVRTRSYGIYLRADTVRCSTSEEIKAEKERPLWEKIGREVGEFKEGDVGVAKDGFRFFSADTIDKLYNKGKLKGFYPAESFVSFEGGEEDA